jgi:hypothetical protein
VVNYVDGYCERLGPGLFAEPLNAVSNLAFLTAAIALAVFAARTPVHVRVLAVLIGLIFLGSTAFHTTATGWGAAADSGFIAVFLLYYVVLFAHLFFAVPWRLAWLAAPAFLVLTVAVTAGAAAVGLAGPGMYASALLVLAGLAVVLRGRPERPWFAWATGVFAVSLTLRTLDGPLCAAVPVGTHFLWHVLNAVALFLVSAAAVRRSVVC